jgi:hypothetical protein
MTEKETRKLIAGYVAGEASTNDAVEEACRKVDSMPEYREHLARELGMLPPRASDCEVFLANLAEFAELAPEQRAKEMPEMDAHMGECLSCRRSLWEVRSLWVTRADARLLIEPIRVAGGSHGLRDAGGPIADSRAPVAEAAGETTRPLVWSLEDAESGYTIRLRMRQESRSTLAVGVRVERESADDGTSDGAPSDGRLDAFRPGSRVPYAGGPLAEYARQPLRLPLGRWSLDLVLPAGSRTVRWTIPLVWEKGRDPA